MYLLKKIVLLCICIIAVINLFPNNRSKADSLRFLAQSSSSDTIKIKAYLDIADYYSSENTDSSLRYIESATRLAEQKTKIHFNSLLELKNKKPDKIQRALILLLAMCYRSYGVYNHDLGNMLKAMDYYQKALRIFEELKEESNISTCNYNIGLMHSDMGNSDLAKVYFYKSLEIDEKLKDYKGIAYTSSSLGVIEKKNKNYQKANDLYERALETSIMINDKIGISTAYTNMALLFQETGKPEKSIEFYNKAYEIDKELGDKSYLAIDLINIGLVYKNTENRKKALEAFYKSLELSGEIKSLPLQLTVYECLSETYEKEGNSLKALKYLRLHNEIKDSIFEIEKEKNINELEVKYQNRQKNLEIENLKKQRELQAVQFELKEQDVKRQRVIIYISLIAVCVIVFISIVLYKANIEKRKANNLLASQNDEIVRQKDRISHIYKELSDSIHYAKRIQSAVIPTAEILADNFSEAFVLFKPKDVVSGDFYWATYVRNWKIIAVADCTGHGVPGAFMSMLGISFLNEIVRKKEVVRASDVLNHLRDAVIESLKQTGESGSQKDGMDISLLVINTTPVIKCNMCGNEHCNCDSTGTGNNELIYNCQWAGANNPLYIIRKSGQMFSGGAAIEELKPDKMPIAIYERMEDFTNHDFQVHSGDTLYLLSDGYQDQFGGPENKKIMSKRLKQILSDNNNRPMSEQRDILDFTIEEWKNNFAVRYEQTDDVTILGLKIS